MRLIQIFAAAIMILCVGCADGGGAVVFAPTPLPPDLSPRTYTHPGGAFTMSIPPDWAVQTENTTTLAEAAFSPPGAPAPILTVSVVNLGPVENTPPIADLINTYQTDVRPDVRRYFEQDRQAMGDGSWRLLGLRKTIGGEFQQVNTFIERAGTFLGVIDAVLPSDPAQLNSLQTLINTFALNPTSPLQPTDLNALAGTSRNGLEIASVMTWTTTSGVFFVTGEVVNYGDNAVSEVPIGVTLYAVDGTSITDAADTVMGYTLPPGGFAPFSLRFGQGRPVEADHYILSLGGEDWQPSQPPVIFGSESLRWTDESSFSGEGHLLIDGTLTNTGIDIVSAPLATVTVFDANQNVIATGFVIITEETLLPDESVDYRIRVPELGGQPANYIVNIQALADE
jgi:hypothetical protein